MKACVIDRATALQRIGGDEELFIEVLALFIRDAPSHLDEIRVGIKNGDRELVRRSAHSFKSASASLGGDCMQNQAFYLEEIALPSSEQDLMQAYEQLKYEFKRFKEYVEQ